MVSKLSSLISSLVAKGEDRPRIRRIIDEVLADDRARDLILHRLGTRQLHDPTRLDLTLPGEAGAEQFEDLLWLLSSNYANRGLALLMLEEAAWLYDAVRAIDNPVVAELGRAKGGTTFLLAAAGADVTSIENGALESSQARRFGTPEVSFDQALENALTRVGIASRVTQVVADALTYPVPHEKFDLVFVDIALRGDRMERLFQRWWDGVKPGGRLVLRDGREPRTPSVMALAESLRGRPGIHFEEPAPGVFTVLAKVTDGAAPPTPVEPGPVG